MIAPEWVSTIIAGLALIASVYSLVIARKVDRAQLALGEAANHRENKILALSEAADERETRILALSHADWELQAQQYIDQGWREFEAVAVRLVDENGDTALLDQVLVSARQRLLNAYDVQCQAYLDKKIDGERFKRAQQRNIIRLFDQPSVFPELTGRNTDYRALVQVYEELRGKP